MQTRKIILSIISWLIFLGVVFSVEYPESLSNASVYQLAAFFTPLLSAIFFTINLFLKSLYKSFVLSFGLVLLLILKALDALNLVTFGIALVAIYLLLGSFKTPHSN